MVCCPRCYSPNHIDKSRWRWSHLLHALMLLRPYRCAICGMRFWCAFWITYQGKLAEDQGPAGFFP